MAKLKIPRDKIPWFPTIDPDLCTGDQDCVIFCKNDVLAFDEESFKAIVVHPFNCVVGCSACAQICSRNAITFPSRDELKTAMRQLLSEARDETVMPAVVNSNRA